MSEEETKDDMATVPDVRSDSVVSPPTQDFATRHDAPISPDVASQKRTVREYSRIKDVIAALPHEDFLSRIRQLSADSYCKGELLEAAAFELLADRISVARAVANASIARLTHTVDELERT